MSVARRIRLVLFTAALLVVPKVVAGQSSVRTGRLSAPASSEAKVKQEFPFQAVAGQRIEVRLTSEAFDAYLELVPPEGDPFYKEPLTNDDFSGTTDSRVTAIASGNGTWRAVVSAYDDSEGDFSLQIELGGVGQVQNVTERTLGEADSVSIKGRRYATYSIDVRGDSQLLIEMISEEFEPTIIAVAPSGVRYTSEEADTEGYTARIDIASAEAGRWRVLATQAIPDEPTGPYALRMIEVPTGGAPAISGELEEDDRSDIDGEYYDVHRVEGAADRPLEIQLISNDFDAFLAARSPSGEWFRDDDGAGDTNARLQLPAMAGTWIVIVTSYGEGETGRYRLTIGR